MFSRFNPKNAAKFLANPRNLTQANKFEARTMQKMADSQENYNSNDKMLALEDNSAKTKPSNFELLKSKVANIKQSTTSFVKMFLNGSKNAYHDARYLSSVVLSKPKHKWTVEEINRVSRIKVDLTKFLPFYVLLVIPGGMPAMVVYLRLFPRGIPTYFMKPQEQMEKQRRLLENQAKAYGVLKEHLLSIMRQKGYQGSDDDSHSMMQFLNHNKQKLLPKLKSSKLSLDLLKAANDFVMYEYIEGTYIINTIIQDSINLSPYCYSSIRKLAGANYPSIWDYCYYDRSFNFESFPMAFMKKKLVKKQFKKKLGELKAENAALLMGYYGDLKDETAIMLAKERGFDTTDGSEARKWLIENWKTIIQANENSQTLSFWESVVLYRPQSK